MVWYWRRGIVEYHSHSSKQIQLSACLDIKATNCISAKSCSHNKTRDSKARITLRSFLASFSFCSPFCFCFCVPLKALPGIVPCNHSMQMWPPQTNNIRTQKCKTGQKTSTNNSNKDNGDNDDDNNSNKDNVDDNNDDGNNDDDNNDAPTSERNGNADDANKRNFGPVPKFARIGISVPFRNKK